MRFLRRWNLSHSWLSLGLILWVSLLSFGLVIPWLGIYGDDWPFVYLNHLQGFQGVVEFIRWVRPVGAYIFAAVSALVGTQFWLFHTLLLLLRAADAFLLYRLVRLVWRECPDEALWAGLLLAVYPAFKQQQLAVEYYPHFIVLGLALLSYWALFRWLSTTSSCFSWLWYAASLILSLNIFFIEYFFGFEIVRLLLLGLGLRRKYPLVSWGATLRRAGLAYLPFLLVTCAFLAWRVFAVRFPTYQPTLLTEMASQPLAALVHLARRAVSDGLTTAVGAWISLLRLPPGGRAKLALAGVSLAAFLPLVWALLRVKEHPMPGLQSDLRASLQITVVGLAALLAAGVPFWVTDLPVRLDFPWDRATLSFAPGACLLAAGLLGMLRAFTLRWLRAAWSRAAWLSAAPAVVVAGLVGLSCGQNFSNASLYLKEWELLRSFYWQIAWRMPGLQPGASLVMDTSPFNVHVDNFLTPLLNWAYAPDLASPQVPYRVFDFYKLQNRGVDFKNPESPIRVAYGTMAFEGTAGDMILIAFEPPGCLRVLSPQDAIGLNLNAAFSDALPYSHPERIIASPPNPARPPDFLPEPERGWCYYYQSTSLEIQRGDWLRAAAQGEQALVRGLKAARPAEMLVLLEAFLHTGRWQAAREVSLALVQDASLRAPICAAWHSVTTAEAQAAQVRAELGCEKK